MPGLRRPSAVTYSSEFPVQVSGIKNATIEVAALGTGSIGIRDSKDPMGPRLSVTQADLKDLIERIKAGRLALR
ncbi:DUF397 domain-containing protein [Actinomadura sp. LD22]|uniref:DUF397 domain-containing protein n=1 Tax=Actinomadura physcomitrii TaxID=2650748 RepID=A0A6I4M7X4_9ACTN|nr:DUF397 domain-containing protein [Actinomadura physcomitrii]